MYRIGLTLARSLVLGACLSDFEQQISYVFLSMWFGGGGGGEGTVDTITRAFFFRVGGGAKVLPPPNILARRRPKIFGVRVCSLQRMCFFHNLFGLVTSETIERREVPFSKHFAAFFENCFLQIFFLRCHAYAKILRLEMLSKKKVINLTRRKIPPPPPMVRPPQTENVLGFLGLFDGKLCRFCIQKNFKLPLPTEKRKS